MGAKESFLKRLDSRMDAAMGTSRPPAVTNCDTPSRYDGFKAFPEAALVPVALLTPDPDQPRKTFPQEEIDRLAASLEAGGMLQPIRVRRDEDLGRWVIVAGERRFRAARSLGWAEVPCVIAAAGATAAEIRRDQLMENCLRTDLPPLEQAAAFREMMDANGWSARRLASELHVSVMTVTRAINLLGLPESVRDRVEDGSISASKAAEIASLGDPADCEAVAEEAVSRSLGHEEVAGMVRARKGRKGRGASRKKEDKVKSRTFRAPGGCRATFERGRGVDAAVVLATCRHIVAELEAGEREDAA